MSPMKIFFYQAKHLSLLQKTRLRYGLLSQACFQPVFNGDQLRLKRDRGARQQGNNASLCVMSRKEHMGGTVGTWI